MFDFGAGLNMMERNTLDARLILNEFWCTQ